MRSCGTPDTARALARSTRAFLGAVGLLCATHLCAATPVSGAISQSTHWTTAGSPYVLSGVVTISGGAQLQIDAGVQVLMSGGAGLEVVAGSIAAQGTSSSPVTITSANDIAGSTPAKGDWGSLVFDAGTVSASTALTYVNVRYGSGIVMNGASPTLRNVNIDHHRGAAISIDLQSSPAGGNLSATDNDLNGIAVPAGEIDADVTWGLTGIPYVVQQGVVAVGKRVFSLLPSRLRLAQGATATYELDIPEPAPAGGQSVNTVSSIPSIASVPASVSIAGGAQTTTVTVNALSIGTSTITASQSGYGNATASVQVVQPGGELSVARWNASREGNLYAIQKQSASICFFYKS